MKVSNVKIIIPEPKWDSELTNLIIDLEKLKAKKIESELPEYIFIQLKNIFHMLETLGSARIEGNNTTLSDFIDKLIEDKFEDEKEVEIINLGKAISFIEKNIEQYPVNKLFISELHKIVTKNLTPPPNGEGSKYPGNLRKHNVRINKAKHTHPDISVLNDYYEEFIRFINQKRKEQYHLLVIAISHHRFAYIHPFDNANGRVGRLLNYALLIKFGFQEKNKRIINPSSVFYSDRNKYYKMLSKADSLIDEDILAWCEYFLQGLKNEIEKIDSLLDRKYVKNKILNPAIKYCNERGIINENEKKVIQMIINNEKMEIKSEFLSQIGLKSSVQKARFMAKLKDKKFVKSIKEGGRIYTINFINSPLLRGVIAFLKKEGFVSEFLER